jgi:hypothetical protein
LRMAEFNEGNMEGAKIFEIVEGSTKFSFCCRGAHSQNDGTVHVVGTINRRQR